MIGPLQLVRDFRRFLRVMHRPDCAGCGASNCFGPMIDGELWLSIADDPEEYLCFGCMEKRLGRRIKAADLIPCSINHTSRVLAMRLETGNPDLELPNPPITAPLARRKSGSEPTASA
jgi:hypothetical protein